MVVLAMVLLQIGHLAVRDSHWSMQSLQNTWLHDSLWGCLKWDRQMGHSP